MQITPPGTTDYFAFVDIPSRVDVLNLSFPYCYFKQTMEDFCCLENRSLCPLKPRANSRINPYVYCIVSEIVCIIILFVSLCVYETFLRISGHKTISLRG